MPVSAQSFRTAMRQLAAAVNVVTSGTMPHRNGLTATAVTSLTAEPAQLGLAVNKGASAFALIRSCKCFAVNVLARDQTPVAEAFSGVTGLKDESRFTIGKYRTLKTGAPILQGAAAAFDCSIVAEFDLGTHVFFVGLVEAVEASALNEPLLFIDGTWAGLVRASKVDIEEYRGAVESSLATLDAVLARPGSPEEQLRSFVNDYSRLVMSIGAAAQGFRFREQYAEPRELAEIYGKKREFDAKLRTLLMRGVQDGSFKIEDAHLAAMAMIGMTNWISRWFKANGRLQDEDIASNFSDLISRMVGVRPESIPATKKTLV